MMKAFGYTKTEPLIVFDTAKPTPGPRDIIVQVKGISINPVDFKVFSMLPAAEGETKTLGYDAAGVVTEVGSDVTSFKVGDEVYHAGDITRPGTNSEYHVVDERLAGKKPTSLGFAEAAALPLTSITAWELLFESLGIKEGGGEGESILIIGGAGGVGSMLIQFARQLTKLTVVTTASRPDTIEWTKKMGAHHVINHRESLVEQMKGLGLAPKYVAGLNATDKHYDAIIELIQPKGHIAIIDDPEGIDISKIKLKALSFAWEFMFTRSMFKTDDMDYQQMLLNRVAALMDDGTLKSTMTQNMGTLSLETLEKAHQHQESGKAIGKTVMDAFV